MDLDKLNKLALDVPTINPAGFKRSDLVFATVLCSEADFAAGRLVGGQYAALWPGHVDVVDDIPGLVEILNKRENILLELGVIK